MFSFSILAMGISILKNPVNRLVSNSAIQNQQV